MWACGATGWSRMGLRRGRAEGDGNGSCGDVDEAGSAGLCARDTVWATVMTATGGGASMTGRESKLGDGVA